MQTILEYLYHGKRITCEQSEQLFNNIIQGKLTSEQLAAVLISMKVRGEDSEEIAGAAKALLAHAKPFPRPNYLFADIVGTGGDHSNSINISTTSAIVAACCGARVAKHGNHSISSLSGSSDLLAEFGVRLDLSAEQARETLDELGICFLFAPQYHTSFYHTMPVRQKLKTSTLFNVLGPLINPARPPLALIGVYSQELVLPIAQTLRILGTKHAVVVHGGGMDEVVLHTATQVAELHDGNIDSYNLSPADFGLQFQSTEDLQGGTPKENRNIIASLLQGKGKRTHEYVIAVNVALLLKLFGYKNLRENTCRALDEIHNSTPYMRLIALVAKGHNNAKYNIN